MKIHLLLIPMLLLACRTTAGTKEKNAVTKPYAAQDEKLLQKIVGAQDTKPNAQIFDCTLMSSEVSDADAIRKLIAEVPRGEITNVSYYFRAHEPSVEIYAYENGQKITLEINHSNWAKRNDAASTALIERINAKCPAPAPKP